MEKIVNSSQKQLIKGLPELTLYAQDLIKRKPRLMDIYNKHERRLWNMVLYPMKFWEKPNTPKEIYSKCKKVLTENFHKILSYDEMEYLYNEIYPGFFGADQLATILAVILRDKILHMKGYKIDRECMTYTPELCAPEDLIVSSTRGFY